MIEGLPRARTITGTRQLEKQKAPRGAFCFHPTFEFDLFASAFDGLLRDFELIGRSAVRLGHIELATGELFFF